MRETLPTDTSWITVRNLELLAPAKNKDYGKEAILHGADSVYIGAPAFGARASAGNSIEDIAELATFAHLYGAKIYVALNTILTDKELTQAVDLIYKLYEVGADAIIVQDVGLLASDLPPIPLHASTQMDLRTPEKVKFYTELGMEQIVVPRELNLSEISAISKAAPDVRLEAFVHGALCVSYSGVCYAAQAFHGRSANRGECSQVCRMAFNLIDANGRTIASNQHLLSIKDLNRSSMLEQMIDAGISSFKIEGRLKDLTYLKSVTAYYHQELERIVGLRDDLKRSSKGKVDHFFTPDLSKAFNRQFTTYMARGRGEDALASFATPKSIGRLLGQVEQISHLWFSITGDANLSNGDGLTFFSPSGGTSGIRANRVEGFKIYPANPSDLKKLSVGMDIYRSLDVQYQKELQQKTAERKLPVDILATISENELIIEARSGELSAQCSTPFSSEPAKRDDSEGQIDILSRWGETIFFPTSINIDSLSGIFVPRSLLQKLKNEAAEKLLEEVKQSYQKPYLPLKRSIESAYPEEKVDFRANIYNAKAKAFYTDRAIEVEEEAFESAPKADAPLMETRHCIKYSLGKCPIRQSPERALSEPLYLESTDGTVRMRIRTDCKACKMYLYNAKGKH
ncbi:MAG: U32 family peptidase [Porphyromonas sp.]|nr:U32 family peptidase [Porphyromonas sp.]